MVGDNELLQNSIAYLAKPYFATIQPDKLIESFSSDWTFVVEVVTPHLKTPLRQKYFIKRKTKLQAVKKDLLFWGKFPKIPYYDRRNGT